MVEMALKLLITIPACMFAGIVLFLASVFKQSSEEITEAEYYAIFTNIITHGRKSFLINIIVIMPLLVLIVFITLYRFDDLLFLADAIIYVIGSFVLSRLLNEPTYTKLLATDPGDTEAVSLFREELNRGNTLRAGTSLLGVVLMGVSYLI